jgi:hypothetical protein
LEKPGFTTIRQALPAYSPSCLPCFSIVSSSGAEGIRTLDI